MREAVLDAEYRRVGQGGFVGVTEKLGTLPDISDTGRVQFEAGDVLNRRQLNNKTLIKER
jgi:hypothetical protein